MADAELGQAWRVSLNKLSFELNLVVDHCAVQLAVSQYQSYLCHSGFSQGEVEPRRRHCNQNLAVSQRK